MSCMNIVPSKSIFWNVRYFYPKSWGRANCCVPEKMLIFLVGLDGLEEFGMVNSCVGNNWSWGEQRQW